jgi:hypothetical protein
MRTGHDGDRRAGTGVAVQPTSHVHQAAAHHLGSRDLAGGDSHTDGPGSGVPDWPIDPG